MASKKKDSANPTLIHTQLSLANVIAWGLYVFIFEDYFVKTSRDNDERSLQIFGEFMRTN